MDGYRVLRTLRSERIDVPVLIITARDAVADRVAGLDHGADDYLVKPFDLDELLARARAVVRRDGESVSLAPLEYDLLLALYDKRGAVVSRLDLMREVWGHQAAVVSRTVDTHILELRKKLERDPTRPRHILTVRKSGYRLEA